MVNTWIRLWRNRPLRAVAIVLCALGVLSSGMAQASDISVTGQVSRNWRGAYDILVTPAGRSPSHAAAETRGLIEPDFISYGGAGGISLSTLSAIRAIRGVSVAAPISFVGYLDSASIIPDVFIGAASLPRRPTLYRMTMSVWTSDGVNRLPVKTQSMLALLGPAKLNGVRVPFVTTTGNLSFGSDGVDLELSSLPPEVSPVEAIDPRAEEKLLGPTSSALSALEVKPAYLRSPKFPVRLIPNSFSLAQTELSNLESTPGPATPIVPIVVADHLPYPLSVSLQVWKVGKSLPAYPTPPLTPATLPQLERTTGTHLTTVGTSTLDLSKRLRAYEPASFTVLFPGSSPPNGTIFNTDSSTDLTAQLAGRASYRPLRGRGPTYEVTPRGRVAVDGTPAVGPDSEQSYRSFVPIELRGASAVSVGNSGAGGGGQPYFLAPVGTFNLAALRPPSDPLDEVPLGAYEQAVASLPTTGGNGRSVHATPNPLGFLTPSPDVITTIAAATLLRGPDPIDAIRVRVGGVTRFDRQAEQKIEAVADRINSFPGVDVRIVAGSSPQPVKVEVPSYYPSGAALGTVTEQWTTLGAAEQSVAALTNGEVQIIVLVVVLAGALLAGFLVVDLGTKRRDLVVYRSLGWSRRRIAWWLTSDAVAAAAVVAGGTVAGEVGFGRAPITVIVGLGLAVAMVAAAALAGLLAARSVNVRHRSPNSPRRSAAAKTPTAYSLALATLRSDVGAFVALVVSAGLGAATLILVYAEIRSSGQRAGPTLLAQDLVHGLRWLHLAALLIIVIAGTASAIVLFRSTLERRATDAAVMSSLGWSRADIAGVLRWHRTAVAAVILMLSFAGSFAMPATASVGVGIRLGLSAVIAAGVAGAGAVVARGYLRRVLGP